MIKLFSMREFITSDRFAGKLFASDSWAAWRAMLIAMMGEELTKDERKIFKEVTHRKREPMEPVGEFWGAIGRRGGKTRGMSALAGYLSACVDYRGILAPNEKGRLPILAASQQQAAQSFDFISGMFQSCPRLRGMVASETSDTLLLKTGISIEVRSANFRTIRGVTAIGAICDEIAFWRVEDAKNPDAEILAALRPSLATTGGPLIAISSPYSKKGEMWSMYRRHFGPDGDPKILVAQAASRIMNPSLPKSVITRAEEQDPAMAKAEYGAQFRDDIDEFVSAEIVERSIDKGITVREPHPACRYSAACDAAGGSGKDSFTMAIAHKEDENAILDYVVEFRPPFSPETVVGKMAETLGVYGVQKVVCDKWASEFAAETWKRNGIICEQSAEPKTEIYGNLLPLLNSGRVRLLDDRVLINQLLNLESRTAWGGRLTVDHPAGLHDDKVNSAALALTLVESRGNTWLGGTVIRDGVRMTKADAYQLGLEQTMEQLWPRRHPAGPFN